jgi:glucokinase
MHYLGIEIGGTKLQIAAGTADGTILERRRFAVDRAAGGQGIRDRLAVVAPEFAREVKPAAIGVGFGGPVDWKRGRIGQSHQLGGWRDFPFAEWLGEMTGVPVFLENDANTAALGEAVRGAGRGHNPVFWINMGSGVGGGLVVDGALYHGAAPGEAEVGHLRLDKSGITVEQLCSGWAVDKRIRDAAPLHPGSPLAVRVEEDPGGEARHLAPALAENDPLAGAILSEVADNLAYALGHVTQLFHPEVVVVGGGLSLIGEPLRAAIAEALPRHVMEIFAPGPRVILAGLGEDSVPVGALVMAASRLDSRRL